VVKQRVGAGVRVGVVALLVAGSVVACQVLAGIRVRITSVSSSDDGGDGGVSESVDSGGAVVEAGNDAAAGCVVALPPRPAAGMSPESLTLNFAVKNFYYRPEDGGMDGGLGFNLDCVDTCPGPKSCKAVAPDCDEDGGRDLAGNALLEAIDALGAETGAENVNDRIAAGSFTFLSQVGGWNGLPDDSQVSVGLFISNGIDPNPDAGTFTPPMWNGSDPWTVDPRTVNGGYQTSTGWHYVPKALTDEAYIANNQLVGQLTTPFQFGLGIGSLTMTDVTFVANLTSVEESPNVFGYRLDGQIAGRISLHSLLALAAVLKDPLDRSQYLCGNDPTYLEFKDNLCAQADIMTDPSKDNMGEVCDGISAAVGFTAYSTTLGPAYLGPPLLFGCDGGVVDCPTDGG
jgi:hypothetical protein